MNRQAFLKSVERHLLFFKPREINVESVIREKCSKVDTDINAATDFAKWIDNAVFKRPEINSDDILEFVVGPCIDSAEFWSDINKTVFYNGYVAGLAGIIKTIYISSDGKFYNHKHELIAENEEDFFDFLLTVEYDFHPIIKESVYNVLREAGWYKGRCVDITTLCNELNRWNIILSNEQLDFIKEFSGITVNLDSERCWFLSPEEILKNIAMHKSENDIGSYEFKHSEHLIRVVDTMDFSYYIDSKGILKVRGIPNGRTTMECINHLVKNSYGWLFDIDEPMRNHLEPTLNNQKIL